MKRYYVLAFAMFLLLACPAFAYEIVGNSVQWENSYGKVSQTPHTLRDMDNWAIVNFTSYFDTEQTLDVAFGFDVPSIRPKEAFLFHPHTVPIAMNYTCDYYFNYTTSPKHFWCWRDEPYYDYSDNTTKEKKVLLFDHDYETGDIPSKTAYWTDYKQVQWTDVTSKFATIDYDYDDKNKWFIVKNVTFQPNETKTLKMRIHVDMGTTGKYDIFIKRSSDSFSQALSTGNYVLLDPWADADCGYRVRINMTQSFGSTNLTWFPMLIKLNGTRIDYAKTNATDIRFYDSDNVLLQKETEYWNESGWSYVWVRKPLLFSNPAETFIYAYYNCTNSNLDNATEVWNESYIGVWHLNQSSGTIYDSTGYSNDGVISGSPAYGQYLVDGGYNFTPDQYINITMSQTYPMTSHNYELWTWTSADANDEGLFATNNKNTSRRAGIVNKGFAGTEWSGYTTFEAGLGAGDLCDGNNLDNTGFIYLVYNYNGTYQTTYENASLINTCNQSKTPSPLSSNMLIANQWDGTLGSPSTMDELRISNVSRSADWINATYLTITDQMFVYSDEESGASATPTNMDLFIDGTESNRTYGYNPTREVNATGVVNVTGLDVKIYVDSDLKNTSATVAEYIAIYGVGVYNFTAEYEGNATFDASSATWWLEIQETPTDTVLYLDGTASGKQYGYNSSRVINATAVVNESALYVQIYQNGSLKANDTGTAEYLHTYGVGVYNLTAVYVSDGNYTASSETWILEIQKASASVNVSVDPVPNITYGTTLNVTCVSNVDDDVFTGLYRNTTNITTLNNSDVIHPAGVNWRFICNSSASENFTAGLYVYDNYTINQANPTLNIAFNTSNPVTQYSIVNASCSFPAGVTVALYNDTAEVGNPYVFNASEQLSINFTCNTSGTSNYTAANDTETLVVGPVGGLVIVNVSDENNVSHQITFDVEIFNTTYSNSSTGLTTYNNNVVTGNVTVVISATGYGTRSYFVTIPESGTASLVGYLVNSSIDETVTFTVKSYNEELLPDSEINISRLIPTETLVTNGYTDTTGKFVTTWDATAALYIIKVAKEGYHSRTVTLTPTTTAYTIKLKSTAIPSKPSYWDYYSTVIGSCAVNNTSRILNCTWNSSSSDLDNITLSVIKINSTGTSSSLCNNDSTNTSGTFICNISAAENATFAWQMLADYNDATIVVDTGTWTDIVVQVFGETGIWVAMLLIMFMGMMGVTLKSPVLVVALATVGVGVSFIMGLIAFSGAMITFVIGLFLAAGILIYKLR